ncbi:hypothetical protein [Bacillus changyiensis]|uniref:hypothetical protein n=1 Tax=Bacillus changyiensis TaxID=3004103 RepID=UPI0022DF1E63|nr:hypothetical protein [Bacillus changyiensis]MDA1477975.1 hypothetical protein [Bacillus changyiensis]
MNTLTGQWDYSNYAHTYEKLVNGTAVFADTIFNGLLAIGDRMSVGTIPIIFYKGYEQFPIQTIIGLVVGTFLFVTLAIWVSKYL